MKKYKKIFVHVLILFMLVVPVYFSYAQQTGDEGSGLVPCVNDCHFDDILKLINTVINFVFVQMVVPIAAIMFAYAGVMLLFSGGSSEKMSKAKSIFVSVAIGLIIAAIAWLVIHSILQLVGFQGDAFGL